MLFLSMTMLCSVPVGWSGGDLPFTHLQVRGRRVGHDLVDHAHALLFLNRVKRW